MVTKAARNASPISLWMTAWRAGASAAMASGPRSIMVPNSFAVSGSLAAITENKTAATMAQCLGGLHCGRPAPRTGIVGAMANPNAKS